MPEIVGEVTDDVITSSLSPLTDSISDRPGWIPPHIISDITFPNLSPFTFP